MKMNNELMSGLAVIGVLVLFLFLVGGFLSLRDEDELEKKAIRDGCAIYDDKGSFVWKGNVK